MHHPDVLFCYFILPSIRLKNYIMYFNSFRNEEEKQFDSNMNQFYCIEEKKKKKKKFKRRKNE